MRKSRPFLGKQNYKFSKLFYDYAYLRQYATSRDERRKNCDNFENHLIPVDLNLKNFLNFKTTQIRN